jgi:hypothetical protein
VLYSGGFRFRLAAVGSSDTAASAGDELSAIRLAFKSILRRFMVWVIYNCIAELKKGSVTIVHFSSKNLQKRAFSGFVYG